MTPCVYSRGRVSLVYIYSCLIFLQFVVVSPSFPEEVSKFGYQGIPEDLNNKTILFPDGVVAMNEHVRVMNSLDSSSQQGASAVMFVIDNSGSMFQNQCNDFDGARFTVTRALLDTLNRKNPSIMVGVVVFESWLLFKPGEDVVFVQCPNIQGAYIKPIKLNGIYNNRTGYQILAKYLETQKAWMGYTELKYKNDEGSMTSINNAFVAAKHGLLNCGLPKNRQFIIFLSDGIANDPGIFPDVNEYVKGTEVPTTFTVYLQWDAGTPVPTQLLDMTNNIKGNGYSVANPQSNIWSIKTSFETLMSLLMKNVILKIVNNLIIFTPNQLTVNSMSVTNWDGSGFQFGKLFPLLGRQTDFGYTIKYSVVKDSITPNGDTIQISMKDTTHDIKYTAEIRSNVPTPDKFKLTWWGRKMGFYFQNALVNILDETMKNIELRFTKYKMDTLYNYSGVTVAVSSLRGGDKETFALQETPDYLSMPFSLVAAAAVSGDGVLQHANADSIIAVFRNPLLPLDTLMISVPYMLGTVYALARGVYFDNDANGFVDSLFIGITGKKIKESAAELMQKIALPGHRQFDVLKFDGADDGIGVSVKENAPDPETYVTSEDRLVIKDTVVMSQGGLLLPGQVAIIDSLAPVVMKASLVDSLNVLSRDELTVEFSEPVKPVTQKNPLKFLCTQTAKEYDAELSVLNQNGKTAVFTVKSLSQAAPVADTDSLNINWIYAWNIYDSVGNNQDNPKNIRRRITVTVIKEILKIILGIFFDNNADGHVDSLFIGISGDAAKIKECADGIVKTVALPDYRNLSVKGYTPAGNGIGVALEEAAPEIRTFVTDKDILVVAKDTSFPQGAVLAASTAPVIDSMAPVIMSARLRDSLKTGAQDELTVIFSEQVQPITQKVPLMFYQTGQNNREYTARLSVVNQNMTSAVFAVQSLNGAASIEDGDSARIYWIYDKNVFDADGNSQNNPANIKRRIQVITIPVGYDLIFKATILEKQKVYPLPQSITTIPQIQKALKNLNSTGALYQGIMIITVEPDTFSKVSDKESLSGTITVYDALGNRIIDKREMGLEKDMNANKFRLIYVWDGRNEQGRLVGSGEYSAVIAYERFYNTQSIDRGKKHGYIGVKEE